MACRRSLTTKAIRFAQQRFAPLFSYCRHEDVRYSDEKLKSFLQSRSYIGGGGGGGVGFRNPRWSPFLHVPMTSGLLFARNMSTNNGGEPEKIEYIADMAADKTMEVVAPAISEVAVAAADSSLPVAALQYAIDGIHCFTGLYWWASIAITTLVIRTLLVPIMINQQKATSRLSALKLELEPINKEMNNKCPSPAAVAECQERIDRVLKENGGRSLITNGMMGPVIQIPVFMSFFFAIEKMVEKVPSFETGGVSWFIDLTTADSFYILPLLSACLIWINTELNVQEGMGMKYLFRGFAALSVPFSATFPKALFCYWITTNFFSLVYGIIINKPSVKKLLNIPPSPPVSQKPTSEEHASTNQTPLAPINPEKQLKGGKFTYKNKKKKK